MRTLGPRVCSEVGAPGRRADTTHLAIVRPGTPIVSRRRARASDFRMPGAPFAWTKAGLELEIGFGDSSIWRRLFRRQVSFFLQCSYGSVTTRINFV